MAATTIGKGPIQRLPLWILEMKGSQWIVQRIAQREKRSQKREVEIQNKEGKEAIYRSNEF